MGVFLNSHSAISKIINTAGSRSLFFTEHTACSTAKGWFLIIFSLPNPTSSFLCQIWLSITQLKPQACKSEGHHPLWHLTPIPLILKLPINSASGFQSDLRRPAVPHTADPTITCDAHHSLGSSRAPHSPPSRHRCHNRNAHKLQIQGHWLFIWTLQNKDGTIHTLPLSLRLS